MHHPSTHGAPTRPATPWPICRSSAPGSAEALPDGVWLALIGNLSNGAASLDLACYELDPGDADF